ALDDALEWLETYGGGKYFVKRLSIRKCKLGYYEFEGEDKEPEGDEEAARAKKLRLKYKPRDFVISGLIFPIFSGLKIPS
ncbi:MAG: hypothetical protein QSU88_11540, partial [Candidatus Methanoperedens sp.]|nr:hypothetical protein [Candidatus Methanoperedens sp.]